MLLQIHVHVCVPDGSKQQCKKYRTTCTCVHVRCVIKHNSFARNAAMQKLSPDALIAELKSSLEWSDGGLAIVQHVWKDRGQALCDKPKEVLSVGQVSHISARDFFCFCAFFCTFFDLIMRN